MKFVIQRVTHARVTVGEAVTGEIGTGYLILIGIAKDDTKEIADKLIAKTVNLRIFEDENGKTNRSLADAGGSVLLVSQFTLYANCRRGNRPDFIGAGGPELANGLYEYIIREMRKRVPTVETGVFGAHMTVELTNDGPFTILLDSAELC